MIHDITAGYLDAEAVRRGKTVVLRSMDSDVVNDLLQRFATRDTSGNWNIGGYPVWYSDGYILCPLLMPHLVREALGFLRELHRKTGCTLADVGCRTVINPEELDRAEKYYPSEAAAHN